MKLYNTSDESIIKELTAIKDGFTKMRRITDNVELLESFYEMLLEVSGRRDPEAEDLLIKNNKYREIRLKERKFLHKKSINNFIEHKDFHRSFSGKVIDVYDKDFNYYVNKSLYLREEQLCEIICDFLNDEFNQADKFIDLVNRGHVYKSNIVEDVPDTLPTAGYTMFNYFTKQSFIVVSEDKGIRDLEMLRVLAHEFGHVIDNLNKDSFTSGEMASYNFLSGYSEVWALMYEKLFLDYMIRNNIFKGNASYVNKLRYLDIYDNFNSLEYLSSLEDHLLVNERYKRDENIVEQISFYDLSISKAVIDDFSDVNLYSYGGLLAYYFAYLKRNDISEFNRQFEIFKIKRAGMFNPKIFEDLGTTPDEVLKIYEKGLDEITDTKLTLKNNTNF